MRKVWVGSAAAMLGMLLCAGAAWAQANDSLGTLPAEGVMRPPRVRSNEPYRMPEPTTYGVLDEMASRAAVMFVGSVTLVRWLGSDESSAGIVAIEFAVEDGIRGPASGTTYVTREWAGLWRDAVRYRVGERRLMLLHAPGPGGLSSPVDGLDGAIPVTATQGIAPAVPSAATARARTAELSPQPSMMRADLRWVQARQMRTVALAPEPMGEPGEQQALPLVRMAGAAQANRRSVPVAAQPLSVEENPSLTEVVGRLRAGDAPPDAAR